MPDNNQREEGQGGGIFDKFGGIVRILVILLVVQMLFNQKSTPAVDQTTGDALPPHAPIFPPGTVYEMLTYISESSTIYGNPEKDSNAILSWHERALFLGDSGENSVRAKTLSLRCTKSLQNNGSLYAHVYLMPHETLAGSRDLHLYQSFPLVRFLTRKVPRALRSLLDNEDKPEENANEGKTEIVGYWSNNFTLNIVNDFSIHKRDSLPEQITDHIQWVDTTTKNNYYPILYYNDFWTTRDSLMLLNGTVSNLDLHMLFEPISFFKWQMMVQMESSFQFQTKLGADESEKDNFKYMLMDNSPWLLAVTFIVTILHTVFDVLAFKNDIAFWKNNKSMEGLSVRSIFINIFMQAIIFLYLLDHEETSFMILAPAFVGILIEAWKVTKAVDVKVSFDGVLPNISFRNKASYEGSVQKSTKEFDKEAMRYLSYLVFPLVIGYSVYVLMYQEHKSWYSWVLSSVTGAIYTFGFIMMTPQLFINYKLKSVAHLPWRVFVYKALNTFIDDLFAFVIRMPTMHRLATLRDDVIFLIYLYQRYLYPVDHKRVNEYGQGGENKETPAIDSAQGDIGQGEGEGDGHIKSE